MRIGLTDSQTHGLIIRGLVELTSSHWFIHKFEGQLSRIHTWNYTLLHYNYHLVNSQLNVCGWGSIQLGKIVNGVDGKPNIDTKTVQLSLRLGAHAGSLTVTDSACKTHYSCCRTRLWQILLYHVRGSAQSLHYAWENVQI